MMDSRLTVIALMKGDTIIGATDLPQNVDVFLAMTQRYIMLWERGKCKALVSNLWWDNDKSRNI